MKMRKIQLLVTSVLILMGVSVTFAGKPEVDFIGRVAKQIAYAEHHQAAVWPGFHPASTPSVIQFSYWHAENLNPWAYGLNIIPHHISWQPLSQLEYPVYF